MPRRTPSPEAAAALQLVQVMAAELRGARRLAISAFGVATAALGVAGTIAFICL